VGTQLNKVSNWNHLKAVIAASDSCTKFDEVSVCSLLFAVVTMLPWLLRYPRMLMASLSSRSSVLSGSFITDWDLQWIFPLSSLI